MNIAIGSDHAGYRFKTLIAAHLTGLGHTVQDFGTDSVEPVGASVASIESFAPTVICACDLCGAKPVPPVTVMS